MFTFRIKYTNFIYYLKNNKHIKLYKIIIHISNAAELYRSSRYKPHIYIYIYPMREVLCRADWLSIYILHILKIDILRVTIIIKCSKHKITSETKSNALLKSVHAFSRKQQNLICCLPQTITFRSVGLRRKAGRKKERIFMNI